MRYIRQPVLRPHCPELPVRLQSPAEALPTLLHRSFPVMHLPQNLPVTEAGLYLLQTGSLLLSHMHDICNCKHRTSDRNAIRLLQDAVQNHLQHPVLLQLLQNLPGSR